MGFFDNLFRSMEQKPESPSGEHPERGFGDVAASGFGEAAAVEGEQARPAVTAVDQAMSELVADLTRLVLDVQPRVTVQPSKRIVSGLLRISTIPVRIVGFQPDRMRVTLQNMGRTGTAGWVAFPAVVAASREEAAAGQGFYLLEVAANDGGAERLTLETQAEVWVCLHDLPGDALVASTDYQYVNFVVEFGD